MPKVVAYNICGEGSYANFINNMGLCDFSRCSERRINEDLIITYSIMKRTSLEQLPAGLSPDYVFK